MGKLEAIFTKKVPIIAMVHLRPLPGSPLYDSVGRPMEQIIHTAVQEAQLLEKAGVDGVQVENMWDIPYLPGDRIGPETVAALAVCAYAVQKNVSIPVGTECHMNGADKALACAVAAGCKWIRVFEYCNAFISQSGYIDAIGGQISRLRKNLEARDVAFLCDVNVKHGSHYIIHDRSVEEQAMDVEAQDGDAVIVTGFDTGMPPTLDRVQKCREATSLPVLLGSGINLQNVGEMFSVADGMIIGSYFKEGGNWKKPVDFERTRAFMQRVCQLREEGA